MNRLIIPGIFRSRVTAFFTGKDPGADREGIGKVNGVLPEKIYLPIQKHTDKIIFLGSSREPVIGDAVITKEKGVLIGVQAADCVPVLIYEGEKGVIGAVHAGWRGTAAGILKKTIGAIVDRYSGDGRNVFVAIGPSIKGCCYAVDHEVVNAVVKGTRDGRFYSKKGAKYYLDLPSANREQALSLGVPEDNIWVSADCTFCNPERFYSYRYLKGAAGRQGGFIGLL
ncbi:MAG: peptidoglycan editing factor PgeF [Nitrospiraceae bacterium]|nr:peptidoglycan editing factor PgeF [Nitrospiraceae bacterium]